MIGCEWINPILRNRDSFDIPWRTAFGFLFKNIEFLEMGGCGFECLSVHLDIDGTAKKIHESQGSV